MSMLLTSTARRLALAGTVVVLGVGGTAAGVAAASSSHAPAKAPRVTAPPPVDHQLCYTATTAQFKIPAGIRLIDQFSPNGFVPTIAKTAVIHCNPVEKILPTGQIFKITNPNAHLACFQIKPPATQPTPTVIVTNQFGSGTLVPSQPNLLCVPSWKSLTGPPKMKPTTPPGLNHFTCYPVKQIAGAYKPPPVMLQDEFAPKPVPATVNAIPAELCLPTEKILPSGKAFPIINPTLHLLCFQVSPTPIISPVWDENQFGTSKVAIHKTNWLCLPSTKKIA
jgi:hypothetical protein